MKNNFIYVYYDNDNNTIELVIKENTLLKIINRTN